MRSFCLVSADRSIYPTQGEKLSKWRCLVVGVAGVVLVQGDFLAFNYLLEGGLRGNASEKRRTQIAK